MTEEAPKKTFMEKESTPDDLENLISKLEEDTKDVSDEDLARAIDAVRTRRSKKPDYSDMGGE